MAYCDLHLKKVTCNVWIILPERHQEREPSGCVATAWCPHHLQAFMVTDLGPAASLPAIDGKFGHPAAEFALSRASE